MSEEAKEDSAAEKENEKPAEDGEETEGEGAPAEGGKSQKKKIILLAIGIVGILAIIPVALHFSGILPLFGDKKQEEGKDAAKDGKGKGKKKTVKNLPPPPVTMDLDEFLVNLNTPDKQSRFLKMTITLELPSEAEKEAIIPYIPRIRDTFQLYLRELREEDVKGSAALYRLREELMLRISKVVYPIKVNDILFKEILTQ